MTNQETRRTLRSAADSTGEFFVMREKVEVVEALVIGSGFGGSVAALRLGEQGVKTVVLERGRWWKITPQQDTFCTYREPDGRAAWFSDTTVLFRPVPIPKFAGIVERRIEDGITVLAGAGVGGGSLVYNGCHYQPSREVFERVFPPQISYDELDQVYYPRVRSVIKPEKIPGDVLASDYYLSSRVFAEQAAHAGLLARRLDIAIDWDIVRQEMNFEKKPSAISGEIWYGVNSGAKRSLDQNYLKLALDTGNVEIRALHVVTSIREAEKKQGFEVTCNEITETGEVVAQRRFSTQRLFLGAGTMGTTELLMRAKARGTLPDLNEHIGKEWGNNGDTFATRATSTRTNPGQGGIASIVIEHHNNPLLPTALIVFPEWDAPEGTLTSLGMNLPGDLGHFTYDAEKDRAVLHWQPNTPGNLKMLDAVEHTYKLLDDINPYARSQEKAGGARSFFRGYVGRLKFRSHYSYQANTVRHPKEMTTVNTEQTQADAGVTAHPLGGAVLGKACDWYGRVKGYKGLYVVDGAMVPGGSTAATNPAHTIAALAERCMDKILAEDFGRNPK
jgi:cholesterol oxidase